jgi:predicted DNA-binding transcriptional regulator
MDERQEKLESLQNEKKPLRIKVLEVLDNPKTIQQISHELGISRAMVRYLLTKLNHKGFVRRRIVRKNRFIKYAIYEKIKKENLMDKRVRLLKIVKIKREDKSDWLFDLETADGYFIANCIEVHNCDWPQTFMSRLYRTRSPKNFVDELEFIANEMPEIKEIFIEDDTFTINKQRVVEICDLIKERKLDIIWSANVRADIPFSVLKKMKEAGCRILIVGFESGNQQILNNIKKGITLEQAEKFTEAAKNAGLKIFGCFMIGLPGETKETIEQTFQFAKKLNPDMAFFQQAVPFPGTEFYNWAKQNGYLITEDFDKWLDSNGRLDFLVSYQNLTNEELRKIRDNLMLRFYLSPKHVWQTITHNLSFDEMRRVFNAAKEYFSYLIQTKVKK